MGGGSTLEEAIGQARELDARHRAAGFDQAALDAAARNGFGNGAFEESVEDGSAVVEEFYPEAGGGNTDGPADGPSPTTETGRPTLRQKLDRRAALVNGAVA